MKHSVDDLFERDELSFVIGIPQSQAYLLPFVPVETKKVRF